MCFLLKNIFMSHSKLQIYRRLSMVNGQMNSHKILDNFLSNSGRNYLFNSGSNEEENRDLMYSKEDISIPPYLKILVFTFYLIGLPICLISTHSCSNTTGRHSTLTLQSPVTVSGHSAVRTTETTSTVRSPGDKGRCQHSNL